MNSIITVKGVTEVTLECNILLNNLRLKTPNKMHTNSRFVCTVVQVNNFYIIDNGSQLFQWEKKELQIRKKTEFL